MATGGKHFKPAGGTPAQRPAPASHTRRTQAPVAPTPATRTPYARAPHAAPTPEPARPKRNVLSTVLIVIGVVLLLVAGGLFIKAQLGYKQAAEFYDGLTSEVVQDSDSKIPVIDFAALQKTNPDVIGWIYVPGTNINYVVAQGKTNDTYLRTLITGEYNANGTVFLDADQTAPGMTEQQATLYGHHMNDGSMFSVVNDTLNQERFDDIDVVYYITPDKTYELKPMFTMQVEDDYVDARVGTFESDTAFKQYLKASLAHAKASAKDATDEIDQAERVMALVTCEDAFLAQTKRAVLMCTLVSETDTVAPGDTSGA